MENEITVVKNEAALPVALSANQVVQFVKTVQGIMKEVMKEGIDKDYAVIPGCKKPSLLKPGAEKLCLTFRLSPSYDIDTGELGEGHRECKVTCSLNHITTGQFFGQGVGSCSTMESKYRYRSGPVAPTGKPVPQAYWNKRKTDPRGAQTLLGGEGYTTKKVEGVWEIVEQGEKMENPDVADTYNTVLKMAKKRALVDAILTAVAASDIFTQDMEEKNKPGQAETKKDTTDKEQKTTGKKKATDMKPDPSHNDNDEHADARIFLMDLLDQKFGTGVSRNRDALIKSKVSSGEVYDLGGKEIKELTEQLEKMLNQHKLADGQEGIPF